MSLDLSNIPYPDFTNGSLISESEFDANNAELQSKLNLSITQVNTNTTDVTTANTNADAAVVTADAAAVVANTADTNADTALSTANTADTNASAAVVTADAADAKADTAITDSAAAVVDADAALAAVAAKADTLYVDTADDLKADISNVLELDNTDVFTPTADYQPSTKKYVDDTAIAGVGDGTITDAKLSAASGDILDRYSELLTRGTGSIPTTGWGASTTDYTYEQNITLTGLVAATDWLEISVDVDAHDLALDAEICPTIIELDGAFTVYCNTAPTSAIGFSYQVVRDNG